MGPSTDREVVRALLLRADRRIRQARAVRHAAVAATVILAAFGILAGWRLAAPVPAVLWGLAGAAGLALVASVILSTFASRPRTDRAAAALDRAALLRDELLTADWLSHRADASPWVEAQIARAARTARTLDVSTFTPIRLAPRDLRRLALSAGILAGLLLVPPSWTRGALGGMDGADLLTADRARPIEDIRALLADERFGRDHPDARDRIEAILQEIDAAVRSGRLPSASTMNALGRELSRAAQEERARARADIGPGHADPPAGSDSQPRDGSQPGDSLARESTGSPDGAAAAASELSDVLDRGARQARTLARELASRGRVPGVPQMAAGDDGIKEGAGEGAGLPGAGMSHAKETIESGSGGNMEAAGHMSGAATPGREAESHEPGSDLTVALEREQIESVRDPAAASELVERRTRQSASSLEYQAPPAVREYAPAGVQPVHPIPWEYRDLVRAYFLERARQTSQGTR